MMKRNIKAEFKNDNAEGFKAPKPENVKTQCYYTLTISPPEMIHTLFDNDDQEKELSLCRYVSEVHKLILRYQQYVEIVLNPELSYKGRLHYHGVIKFLDIFGAYFYFLPRLSMLGYIEIDTIKLISDDSICEEGQEDGLGIWWAYCTKQSHIIPTPIIRQFNNIPVEIIVNENVKIKCKQAPKKREFLY